MKRHEVPKFPSTFRGDPASLRVSQPNSRSGNLYCTICDGKSRFIWSNSSKNYPHSPVTEKVKVFFYRVVPVFRKSIGFWNVTRPRLSSGKSNVYRKMSMEQWWNGTDKGKTEVLGEKHYTAWVVHE